MKIDGMEGEMEEILKDMLYGERLYVISVYVFFYYKWSIKIFGVGFFYY